MVNPQSIEALQRAALQLQPDARVQLAHSLVRSLDALPEAEFAQLWLAEAERRDAELGDGSVSAIAGDDVFKRIHDRYGQ